MPATTRRARRCALIVPTLLLVAASSTIGIGGGTSADAAVDRQLGYAATVDGFTSWYGSYSMGALGTAWCLDHGIAAPDPALDYRPTTPAVALDTRTAVAWIVGRYGEAPSRVDAAALMLAVHDLMGAVYPSGRLDLDRLTPARMAGFDQDEAAVLARARALKAEALAHRSLRGPYQLVLGSDEPRAGEHGTLTVGLVDGDGRPVHGAEVRVRAEGATLDEADAHRTDGDGLVRVGFRAGADNRFVASAVAPDLDLAAHAPTRGRAQRVAVPRRTSVEAAHSFRPPGPPPPSDGELVIDKHGDAEPLVPVAGAVFDLTRGSEVVASATIGEDGRSAPVELAAGRYTVVEREPPPGYDPAEPSEVEITSGERTRLEVRNRARPGRLAVSKSDRVTGAAVAGATIEVRAADADEPLTTFESEATPTTVEDLAPGTYLVTETSAPDGYERATDPVEVVVLPDETTLATLENTPRSGVAFEKVPDGPVPDDVSLAGAVFAVRAAEPGAPGDPGPDEELRGAEEVGRCTTDAAGACRLDGLPLVAGSRACWAEERAPEGFAPADGGCFTAGGPGSVHVVEVVEPSTFVEITASKTDAADRSPLAGAVYALHALPAGEPDGTDGTDEADEPDGTDDTDGTDEADEPDGTDGTGEADEPNGTGGPDGTDEGDEPDGTDGTGEADEPDGTDEADGPPAPPADDLTDATLLVEATSSADGSLSFGLHPPGPRYCLVEQVPPPGYQRDPAPACRASVASEPIHVELVDHPLSPAPEPPTPPATVPRTETEPPAPDAPAPTLPRTGAEPASLALVGLGVAAIGGALAIGAASAGGDGRLRRRSSRRAPLFGRTRRTLPSGDDDEHG